MLLDKEHVKDIFIAFHDFLKTTLEGWTTLRPILVLALKAMEKKG